MFIFSFIYVNVCIYMFEIITKLKYTKPIFPNMKNSKSEKHRYFSESYLT